MQKEDYFLALAIISIGVFVGGLIAIYNQNYEIYFLKEKVNNLQANLTKLNNTQTNMIKYLAERNEPFMKEVIKYANETNQRLEKLENHK